MGSYGPPRSVIRCEVILPDMDTVTLIRAVCLRLTKCQQAQNSRLLTLSKVSKTSDCVSSEVNAFSSQVPVEHIAERT